MLLTGILPPFGSSSMRIWRMPAYGASASPCSGSWRCACGNVCVQFLDGGVCDPLAIPNSLLEEMAVCKDCRLDLYRGDDAGLVILHRLGDVCHISLLANRLAVDCITPPIDSTAIPFMDYHVIILSTISCCSVLLRLR